MNPALVAAHARAWVGVPRVTCGQRREVGADCAGLVAGIYGELTGRLLPPADWPADPERAAGRILDGFAAHGRRTTGCAFKPGLVAVFRFGPARLAHVGIWTDRGLVHAADYAGRVVEDGWAQDRTSSSVWTLRLGDDCEPGPADLDVDTCVAVIHRSPEPGARVFAEIQAEDGTLLARTRHWADVEAALEALGPIYQHIETVE